MIPSFFQVIRMTGFLPEDLSDLEALLDEGARFSVSQTEAEALREYERVLAVAPRDRAALRGMAETLHRLGRLEEALQAWQRVVAVMPSQADAYVHLGDVLYD